MNDLFLNILIISLITNIFIGIYGIVFKPNIIKKIISLTIFNDSICVLIILHGYLGPGSIVPIHILPFDTGNRELLLSYSVDPLPQAIVLTAIVIGLAFTVFLSVTALRIYEVSGSLNLHYLLKSEVVETVEPEVEVMEE